jgi:hypothetical protein
MEMSFTSDSILQHLDKGNYPLLNVNYDIAAVRVLGFCNQEKWAIIFEVLMSYPSSDGIGLHLFAYGTGLKVEQGFSTPCLHNPFNWRKGGEQEEEIDFNWRKGEEQEEEIDDIDPSHIPEVIEVHVRNQRVAIHTKDVIRLNRAPEFDFDLLNYLIDTYDEDLYSTDKELYLYVSKDLKKLVQFDNWYHEDDWQNGSTGAGVWEDDRLHIPIYTLGVKVIAQILETRNLNLYRSQAVENLGFDWEVFE